MYKFIEVSNSNGQKILINIDAIESMHSTSDNKTKIYPIGIESNVCYEVAESIVEIKKKIEDAQFIKVEKTKNVKNNLH